MASETISLPRNTSGLGAWLAARPALWLGRAGGLGLYLPLGGFAAGICLPGLAGLARGAVMPAAAFALFVMVMLAEPGRINPRGLLPPLALAGATLLLSPLLALALFDAFDAPASLRWLVLVAACPVASGATLVAGLVGLPMRPVLLTQLLSTFALPVTAPLIALLLASELDAGVLLHRVVFIVALPAMAALVLRHRLGSGRDVVMPILRGSASIALAGVGCAVSAGFVGAMHACADPVALIGGVLLVSGLTATLGAVAGLGVGLPVVAALGLAGALRNGSVLWAATQGLVPAEGTLPLQVLSLWTFLLPALLGGGRRCLHLLRRPD